jgi:hypothetical protein
MRVSVCGLLALIVATPVLADPPGDYSTNVQMSQDRVYSDGNAALEARQHEVQSTCMQLMERAFYMADPASLDRAMDAHHEMEMARAAFQTGDEYACQHHAMRALNDRS